MIQFGVECVATGRFDTILPARLMTIFEQVDADRANDLSLFSDPKVYAAASQLLTQLAAKAPDAKTRAAHESYGAALAWRTGHYADAVAALDKLGARLDPAPFAKMRGNAPAAASQSRIMAGPDAPALLAADADAAAGRLAPALAAYAQVAAKLPKDHPGQLYLTHRRKLLEVENGIAGGAWTKVTPTADFSPWEVLRGEWKVDPDGGLVATADADGYAMVVCRARLGPSYEIKAKVNNPDPKNAANSAVYVGWWQVKGASYAGLTPDNKVLYVSASGMVETKAAAAPKGPSREIDIVVHGGTFDVSLDGAKIFPNRRMMRTTPPDAVIALGIAGNVTPGSTVRFTDVQVRRGN